MNTNRVVRVLVVAAVMGWCVVEASAAHWGEITPKQCTRGKREYSAILWDIPLGTSWERSCLTTPGVVAGRPARLPDRCVINTNAWGIWEIDDPSCSQPAPAAGKPRWGDITPKMCVANGIREYSGILWDIPAGKSWEHACRDTPASVAGHPARRPDACVTGANVWGLWKIPDVSCRVRPGRR